MADAQLRHIGVGLGGLICLVVVAHPLAQQPVPTGSGSLLPWSEAVKVWQKQDHGAAVELSKGVLCDCVAHSSRRAVYFPPEKVQVAGSQSCRAGQDAACVEEAERDFGKAINLDPSLVEAQLRLASSRSERSVKDSLGTLETIFNSTDTSIEFRYLAAMFRGKAAWSARDAATAVAWFERAESLNQRWLSARLSLAAAQGHGDLPSFFDESVGTAAPSDPWYAYRCTVLTPSVSDALAGWIQRVKGRP